MQSRPEIFLVTTVLLVPFIYATSSIPDACAVPADPEWWLAETCDYVDETHKRVTCCWSEPDINHPGEFITWCQTCEPGGKNCGPISLKQSAGPMGIPPGGVLEDPSTIPKLGQDVLPKEGGVLEQPEDKMTFSKSNVPFPQSNDSDDNNDSVATKELEDDDRMGQYEIQDLLSNWNKTMAKVQANATGANDTKVLDRLNDLRGMNEQSIDSNDNTDTKVPKDLGGLNDNDDGSTINPDLD